MRWWVSTSGAEIAHKEGLLTQMGPKPLCSICLDKWSSHPNSQACSWVGSWGGETVLRYWGRWHQNHTAAHPLWSLKPCCTRSIFGRCCRGDWACCCLVLTPPLPKGSSYGLTKLQTGRTGLLRLSPIPNLLMWQDSKKCIMNWLRMFWACIAPGLPVVLPFVFIVD